MSVEQGCDIECDGTGYFWTMNRDGRYGPLFPRRMPCPYHPGCREVCRHQKLERRAAMEHQQKGEEL